MASKHTTSKGSLSRRGFISSGAAAAAAVFVSPVTAHLSRAAENERRPFRFFFMPCIQLRRDLRSPEGFAAALQAVRKLSPAADFILTGGDMCHNMRDQTIEESVEITDRFLKIFKENCTLPVHHCLGNHDLAAWNKVEAANDPR